MFAFSAVARAWSETKSDRSSSSSSVVDLLDVLVHAALEVRVVREHRHPEGSGSQRDAVADLAVADEPERVAAQVAADELRALPVVPELVPLVEEALRLREAARKHDEERERLVGDRLGVLAGRVDERQPRAVTASTSTLTGPPRAQQTSFSSAEASSTASVTGAPWTTSTSTPAIRSDELRRRALVLPELQLGRRRGLERPRSSTWKYSTSCAASSAANACSK